MYISPINELFLHGVFDRGIPNQERIVIQTQATVNLAAYGLLLTVFQPPNYTPLPDQFFWFGETILDAGAWVFVYTGIGTPRLTKTTTTNEPAYVLHWNRSNVIFQQQTLQPTLIRIDAATNGRTEYPALLPK